MRFIPLEPGHLADAAALFVASLRALRRRVPALSGDLASVDTVAERLAGMPGVVAVDGGRLVGYLASRFPIAGFRGTERVGAYVPEWAHATVTVGSPIIDRALYRAASGAWAAAGCSVHAITLLEGEMDLQTWFWNGFGLTVVDAVRAIAPLEDARSTVCPVRAATPADASVLAVLDVEHRRHYTEPPVFMPLRPADDDEAWRAFLANPGNSAWLAEDDAGPFGFIRFDRIFGGSDIVESKHGVFISGAYVRPSHRGRGAATAILDAALRHYAESGDETCAVDFEAFNPEATAFWLRHFAPVCYSLTRVPEATGT